MTSNQMLIYNSLVFDHADLDRDLVPYHGQSKRPILESVVMFASNRDVQNFISERLENVPRGTNCRNCGANSTKNGRCDYCGSDR